MTTDGRIPPRQIEATGSRDNTTFLRGDGVWVAPAGPSYGTATELADVNAAAEAAGASTLVARADHKHGVATAAPVALTGATQAVGTSTSLARADHQHGIPALTSTDITDFTEAAQDAVAAMLASGANVTLAYDDVANSLTVTASGGDAELMRDTIGTALVGINGVTVTVNDGADTITLAVSGLTIAQTTGLQAALDGKVDGAALDADVEALVKNTGGAGPLTSGALSATYVAKGALVFNVKDYGAIGDGVTDDRAAIQAALDAANTAGGGVVHFPPGTYRKSATSAALTPRSNVIIRGTGWASVLFHDTDNVGTNELFYTPIVGTGPTNWGLENIACRGSRAPGLYASGLPQMFWIHNSVGVRFSNVKITDTKYMATAFTACDDVVFDRCTIMRTNADGIRFVDTPNIRVTNCYFRFVNDDAIGFHTTDATAAPLRSGIVIANNIVEDAQGFAILGAKNLVVTGNTMRRIMSYGLMVGGVGTEGNTSSHDILISDNIILDVFARQESPPRNGAQHYIYLANVPRAGSPAPGTPSGGVVSSSYGTATGSFYTNTSTDQPGGYRLTITNNILARTLPAVAAWSDWGYGAGLEVGDVGVFNGAIPDSALATNGIYFYPFWRDVLVSGNTISTTGPACLYFKQPGAGSTNLEYDNFVIENNLLSNWSLYGITWESGTATNQNITVRDNKFDGDPQFRHANRGANGTWTTTNGGPLGVWFSSCTGWVVEDNEFRNVAAPVGSSTVFGSNHISRNLVRCDPVSSGAFSVSNKGVGDVPDAGGRFVHLIEDSDPASATFRHVKNSCTLASTAMPASGTYVRGHFVINTQPTLAAGEVLLGWARLTTGTAHVLNTDWVAVYASYDTGWIAATYENSWVDFGGGYAGASYRRIGKRVQLRGRVKSGTAGSVIFTLPNGYRPLSPHIQPVTSNNLYGQVFINNTGTVSQSVGNNTDFCLDGVSFLLS